MAYTGLSDIERGLDSLSGGRLTPPLSQNHHGPSQIHTLPSTNTNSSSGVTEFRQLYSLKVTLFLVALVIRAPVTPLSWLLDESAPFLIIDSLLLGAVLLATAYIHLRVASLTAPVKVSLVPGAAVVKWFSRQSSRNTVQIRDGRILSSSERGDLADEDDDNGNGGEGRWLNRTFTWRPRYLYWPCAWFETVLITFAFFNGDGVFRRCVVVAVVAGTWYVGLEAAGRGQGGSDR